jgi:hypothetical protein
MPAQCCGGPCVRLTRRRRASSASSSLSEFRWHSLTFGDDDGLEHCSLLSAASLPAPVSSARPPPWPRDGRHGDRGPRAR